MTSPRQTSAAILIAPNGPTGPLQGLVDRLVAAGLDVAVVDDLETGVEISHRHSLPPAVLLDLRHASTGEIEDQQTAGDAIRRVIAALPTTLPVVVTNDADPVLIVACIRAGAADLIDLSLEGTAAARAVVQRICERQATRVGEVEVLVAQRTMIEDMLKDLIRTERRTIDAEEALAAARTTGEIALEGRPPSVLLVEHERQVADELADLLEAGGIATFAYVTGEEALREATTLAHSTGLDLALVAAQLPGIDGLETVRRLRASIHGLPAFLMTSVHDADLAEEAADLGVVGFVHKPLAEIGEVVARLSELARESLQRTREHVYLQRIKERHEDILARYRSLPREP